MDVRRPRSLSQGLDFVADSLQNLQALVLELAREHEQHGPTHAQSFHVTRKFDGGRCQKVNRSPAPPEIGTVGQAKDSEAPTVLFSSFASEQSVGSFGVTGDPGCEQRPSLMQPLGKPLQDAALEPPEEKVCREKSDCTLNFQMLQSRDTTKFQLFNSRMSAQMSECSDDVVFCRDAPDKDSSRFVEDGYRVSMVTMSQEVNLMNAGSRDSIELEPNKTICAKEFWSGLKSNASPTNQSRGGSQQIPVELLDKHFCVDVCNIQQEKFFSPKVGRKTERKRSSMVGEPLRMHQGQRQISIAEFPAACMLHPLGPCRCVWCLLSLVLIGYDAIFVPLEVFPFPDNDVFYYIDLVGAAFWSFDLVLNFRIGYFAGPGGSKLIMRPRQIAQNYLTTWFLFDAFIIVSEWIGIFAHGFEGTGILRVTRAARGLRSLKLLRVSKIPSLSKLVIIRWSSAASTSVMRLIFSLVKMSTGLLLVIHFIICGWYAIGDLTHDGWTAYASLPVCAPLQGYADSAPSWDAVHWYFVSARWVLAQVNGRTDQDTRRNMFEMVYTCIVAVFGPLICMAVFCSSITATMMELYATTEDHRDRLTRLHKYLELYQYISSEVSALVKLHVREYQNLRNDKTDEETIVKMLPKELQRDLLYEVRAPIVYEHDFFFILTQEHNRCMKRLCTHALTPEYANHGDILFERGDPCTRVYFVYRGEFYYSTKKNMKMSSRGRLSRKFTSDSDVQIKSHEQRFTHSDYIMRGACVSEASLWVEAWKNRGSFMARTDGFYFALCYENFVEVVENHVEALAFAIVYALEYAQQLKNASSLSDIMEVRVLYRRSSVNSGASIEVGAHLLM